MNLTDGASAHFVPWLVFAGILWTSIILDISAIKTYLGTSWFRAFLPAVLLAGIAPALYLAISLGTGGKSPFAAQGLHVSAYPFARPYTPAFFALCAGIGVAASLIKGLVLGRFSPQLAAPLSLVKLILLSTISATVAIGEMNLDSRRMIALVYGLAGIDSRQVTTDPSLDPMKSAKPLLDYYQKLDDLRKE